MYTGNPSTVYGKAIMSIADAIDAKVIDSDAPKEEKKVVALGWKARAAAAMQRGLTIAQSGSHALLEGARAIARRWKVILIGIMILVGVLFVIACNVLFLVWIYSVSPILFWVLIILYVLNLVGTLISTLS